MWEAGVGRSRLVAVQGSEQAATLRGSATASLPQGVVTFLLTDVEGSSRLWEADAAAMRAAMSLHDELVERAVGASGGLRPVEQGEGDSVVVAFGHPSQALACALELQRGLRAAQWPVGCELRVRVALHSGEALSRDAQNYVGPALNRCARLRALAHGGQTLVSRATYELIAERLPQATSLTPLGPQRLRDLGRAEEVFELAHPELPSGFPPLRSLDLLPNNLPLQLSSFVGRERELAELGRLLADHRLITLTGAGGCGKTRLALQAASETLERFPDGAWWVELAPLGDEALVGAAIAEALGVRPLPGMTPLQAAGAYLASHRALVILDNCEHLLGACAEAAESLLQADPDVVVLATSRAPLRVGGETDWRVPSLSLPTDGTGTLAASDAVGLFLERARGARPGFELSDDNAEVVAAICSELDGLPLAIELAAARLRMLSAEQIATGVSDRFRLLTGGPRTATPRLKTLRASVDWSYELLSDDEQVLLRRVAVFAGGFTLEAAEEVCAGEGIAPDRLLDLLASLVDQSLVIAEERDAGVRYRLLETVRQYGLERLAETGEEDALRGRHRDFFLALAERAAPHLETGRQREWLQLLDPEAANLAAAIEYALRSEARLALRFCAGLYRWWCARGRFAEAEHSHSRSLDACGDREPALRARAFVGRAYVAITAGKFEAAESHATEALALAVEVGDQSTAARARCELVMEYANPRAGRAELARAAELAQVAGDEWALVTAKQLIALTYLFQSDHAQAARANEEVAALAERLADPFQVARRWFFVGWMAHIDGRFAEARNAIEHLRAAVEGLEEPVMEAFADWTLALVDVWEGEPDRALKRLQGQLERTLKLGAGIVFPGILTAIAFAELAAGRLDEARGRLEGLLPIVEGRESLVTAWALGLLAEARRLLADRSAASTALEGQATGERIGNRLFATRARLTLGRLAAARGEWTVAQQHVLAHLDACVEGGHATYVPACLDALGEVAAGLQSNEDAARLFAAAEHARAEIGVVRIPPEQQHWAAIDARLREALGDDAYKAARTEGAELSTEDALEWARRARGPRRRPPGGWESLTPTEVKVVELVAQGLTNPQIGERMFISPGTVKTHLAHVFRKLDVHSRAELSAQAVGRRKTAS
jgi:predicted ATPase/class 3 adenylate cyclase/DNA-binding CsgD family transcriptional regulator